MLVDLLALGYPMYIPSARWNVVTKIQKWGNSQGLRLPKGLLSDAQMDVGDEVDIVVRGGTLVVAPARQVRGRYDLRALVRRMPKGQRSAELDWGSPQGREVW